MTASMLIDFKHVTRRDNGDGTSRYYFRRRGQPIARLPGEPGSDEFMAAYNSCLARNARDLELPAFFVSRGALSRHLADSNV